MADGLIALADVRAAAERLAGTAHRTPVVTSRTLGAGVFLKAESLQRAGAFKFRGAFNRIGALSEAERAAGVVAYSSGNHAQAVALAASLAGTRATIFMPEDAPASKRAATRGYGAEVLAYDRYRDDRAALADAFAAETGAAVVPPYDDPLVMAGQGTVALELLEDVPDLDVLVVPVGGGGLAAGCATAGTALRPGLRVVGVEPEAGDDHRRSLAAGERVTIEMPRTLADGLQLTTPGELTWQVNARLLAEVVTVSDAELVEAMRFLFERLKLVVEPSGAAGVAAYRAGRIRGDRVGIVLSGGNVGADRFAALVAGPAAAEAGATTRR